MQAERIYSKRRLRSWITHYTDMGLRTEVSASGNWAGNEISPDIKHCT